MNIYCRLIITILIFLKPFGCLSQSNFTDQDVITLDSLLTYYEKKDSVNVYTIGLYDKQVSLFKQQSELDTLLLFYKNEEAQLLQSRVGMYKELYEITKPKWYDKKWIWFTLGCVTITTSAYVLDRVN